MPILPTNSSPHRKKSILAKVGSDAKGGVLVNEGKMNIHSSNHNLHQISGCFAPKSVHFGAKHSAIWCKTQCILVLSARHFGAKRKTKCC
jgi:hypothetical protein